MVKNIDENEDVEMMEFDISEDIPQAENYEYVGDLPPARQYLSGVLKRMYLHGTRYGVPMLKVLYRATETEYDGYTAWNNVTLSPESAFLWQPLCRVLDVTVADLAKRTKVDKDNETKMGWLPILSIGECKPEDIPVEFAVKYRMHNGIMSTDVIKVRAVHKS